MNARMYSSVTAPLSSKAGRSRVSNSSFSQPAPTPRVTRPLERTSKVARALAAKKPSLLLARRRVRRVVFVARAPAMDVAPSLQMLFVLRSSDSRVVFDASAGRG